MARCLLILTGGPAIVGLLSAAVPRITPSGSGLGGLTGFDLMLMILVPIAAFAAGRHWYRRELFLLYGGAGMLLFVPAYISDNNLRRTYTENGYGHGAVDAILHDTAAWTIAAVAMAVLCLLLARWARRRFPAR